MWRGTAHCVPSTAVSRNIPRQLHIVRECWLRICTQCHNRQLEQWGGVVAVVHAKSLQSPGGTGCDMKTIWMQHGHAQTQKQTSNMNPDRDGDRHENIFDMCDLAIWTGCLWALTSVVAAGEPFKTVVVPVGPNNPRNSEAAIIPLQDGSLLLGWTEFYAGSGADHGPARISGKRSSDAGRTWGDKYTLVENDGGCNVMEVNFLRLGDGRIALFYCQKNSENADCRVMMRTSSDEGRTFGEPRQLSADGKYTGLTNGRCIRLKSGRILLEAWEAGDSYCYLSDDDGQTWRESQRIKPGDGSWEPACIELKDGRVLMLTRTGLGGQYQSLSADGGATWSEPVLSQLVGTAAPVSISRIPTTGDLLAIWNHNPGTADAQNRNRNPLTAAISRDEGQTWAALPQHRRRSGRCLGVSRGDVGERGGVAHVLQLPRRAFAAAQDPAAPWFCEARRTEPGRNWHVRARDGGRIRYTDGASRHDTLPPDDDVSWHGSY